MPPPPPRRPGLRCGGAATPPPGRSRCRAPRGGFLPGGDPGAEGREKPRHRHPHGLLGGSFLFVLEGPACGCSSGVGNAACFALALGELTSETVGGGLGGRRAGRWCGSPKPRPCALSEGRLCSSGRPSAPRVSALCRAAPPRRVGFPSGGEDPGAPSPSEAGPRGWIWGSGGSRAGAEVGRRAWRAIRPAARQVWGHAAAAAGPASALPTRGSRAPERDKSVFCDGGWPTPSQRQAAAPTPGLTGEGPPRPRLRRGVPAAWSWAPPGSTCHCGLCSRSRRRALTAASVAAVPLGFVCPRLPARPLPARLALQAAPRAALGAPAAPGPAEPTPAAARSFLFHRERLQQTEGDISRRGARRGRQPKRDCYSPRPTRTPSRSRGAARVKRAPGGVRGERCGAGRGGRGWGPGSLSFPAPGLERGAGAIGRARCSPPPRLAGSRVWLRPGTAGTLLGGRVLRSARGEGAEAGPRPSVASRSIPWGGSAASPAGHLGGSLQDRGAIEGCLGSRGPGMAAGRAQPEHSSACPAGGGGR